MDEQAITTYITTTFAAVKVVWAAGDGFFSYAPVDGPARLGWQPFATLLTGDRSDQASDLERSGVYRLNIGISRASYAELFGPPPHGVGAPLPYDFRALDVLMPHPVYATLAWVCVLNPSAATFEQVKPLLSEAYTLASKR